MQYLLFDRNEKMVSAWQEFFHTYENVKLVQADVSEIKCDALVSPANSFGFMDGGIDAAISEKLGWELQSQLQNEIKKRPMGELLVGESMLLETEHEEIPYLISSPTMRVPMNFNIGTSINAYLAMKATLVAAKNKAEIQSVAIPGFCTGVGAMPRIIAARQMHAAFQEIELGKIIDFNNFVESQKQQYNLNPQSRLFH